MQPYRPMLQLLYVVKTLSAPLLIILLIIFNIPYFAEIVPIPITPVSLNPESLSICLCFTKAWDEIEKIHKTQYIY